MNQHPHALDFDARFDRGEIEWNGDDCVVVRPVSTRERMVARLSEILPEQAAEIARVNA